MVIYASILSLRHAQDFRQSGGFLLSKQSSMVDYGKKRLIHPTASFMLSKYGRVD